MSKHRPIKRRAAKLTMTAGIMGSVATLLAPTAVAEELPPLTKIFVDGTMPFFTHGDSGAHNMAGGLYYNLPGQNSWALYPRTAGILTGFRDPGYDESRDIGAENIVYGVYQVRGMDPGMAIYVVGEGQGADATVEAKEQLIAAGFDLSNVYFVEAGSPRNNDGGIQARLSFLPAEVYMPLVGVTIGGPDAGNIPSYEANEVQVAIQYEGIADAPKYPLNLVATTNAIAGYLLLHDEYDEVNLDDPRNEVTMVHQGHITNILVYTEELPLLTVAKMFGMPDDVAVALDPFVRAVVEAGYDRPDPNEPDSYPAEPVPFALVPPPDERAENVKNIKAGFKETVGELKELVAPRPANVSVQMEVDLQVSASVTVGDKPVVDRQEPVQQLAQPEHDTQAQVSLDSDVQDTQALETEESADTSKPRQNVLRHGFRATHGASQEDDVRNTAGNSDDDAGSSSVGPVRNALKKLSGALRSGKSSGKESQDSSSQGAGSDAAAGSDSDTGSDSGGES